jgi:hypothetical protein
MEKKQKQPRTVVLKPLPGFQPGHARLGGRTKRTAAQARSLADELGVDPLAYLLNLLAVDATEELEFNADGTEKRVKVPVTRDLKIDICKTLAVFFYPRRRSGTADKRRWAGAAGGGVGGAGGRAAGGEEPRGPNNH